MQELDLGRTNFLQLPTEQMVYLFQTVFSLPQLSQLTLNLAYSVVSLQHYEMIHRLWAMYGFGECLKEVVCGCYVFVSNPNHKLLLGTWNTFSSFIECVKICRFSFGTLCNLIILG